MSSRGTATRFARGKTTSPQKRLGETQGEEGISSCCRELLPPLGPLQPLGYAKDASACLQSDYTTECLFNGAAELLKRLGGAYCFAKQKLERGRFAARRLGFVNGVGGDVLDAPFLSSSARRALSFPLRIPRAAKGGEVPVRLSHIKSFSHHPAKRGKRCRESADFVNKPETDSLFTVDYRANVRGKLVGAHHKPE